jgi:hypothetical protein
VVKINFLNTTQDDGMIIIGSFKTGASMPWGNENRVLKKAERLARIVLESRYRVSPRMPGICNHSEYLSMLS